MITVSITLNGNTQKKQIPTCWDDVTFAQYLELLTPKTDADLLAMFTGVDVDTIRKAKIKGVEDVFLQLEFLREPAKWDEVPKSFLGQLIPKDITFEALGPYADCRTIIGQTEGKDLKDFVEAYAKYCAIYVQAISTNWEGYDYDKAIEFVPEIMNQPAGEVVGLGSFFITKLLPVRRTTETTSPKKDTPLKK